jgi:hypothetical protein
MHYFKTVAAENSHTIGLPTDILVKLGLTLGQWVAVQETEEGILLTAADEVIQEQLAVAEKVMRKNHEALRRLAES